MVSTTSTINSDCNWTAITNQMGKSGDKTTADNVLSSKEGLVSVLEDEYEPSPFVGAQLVQQLDKFAARRSHSYNREFSESFCAGSSNDIINISSPPLPNTDQLERVDLSQNQNTDNLTNDELLETQESTGDGNDDSNIVLGGNPLDDVNIFNMHSNASDERIPRKVTPKQGANFEEEDDHYKTLNNSTPLISVV